jgi:glycerol-3-phosphate dehydrogenase (NAD(P)+)
VRFTVVGGGSWGTAFACLLRDREHEVVLACRDAEQARVIDETRRNPRYLTDISLGGVAAAPMTDAPYDVDVVVLAVPSRAFDEVAQALPGNAPVLSLTKGLDPATGARLSTRVTGRPVAVLSGPNMAEEVAAGLPSAAVVASDDRELAEMLQHAINSSVFRVYVNDDLVGVELCAAAKNVIALSAGGVDGLGLGDNAKASLIIAQGRTPDEAAAEIGQVVEGLTTAPVLRDLSHRVGVELPITEGVCSVLEGQDLQVLLASLMGRRPTEE